MDINLKVTIESPAVIDVLKGLIEVLQGSSQSVNIMDVIEVEQSEVAPETVTVVITIEEVRSLLAKLSQSGKQKEVKALIEKYGAKKLTDIEPSQYANLMKEAEGL